MDEIVARVQRVTDIIGEITAAAAEQSDGIGQVNGAVTQLDQMTQQNAALVEQSAAAAESLQRTGQTLSGVAGFKLDRQPSTLGAASALDAPRATRRRATPSVQPCSARKPIRPRAAGRSSLRPPPHPPNSRAEATGKVSEVPTRHRRHGHDHDARIWPGRSRRPAAARRRVPDLPPRRRGIRHRHPARAGDPLLRAADAHRQRARPSSRAWSTCAA